MEDLVQVLSKLPAVTDPNLLVGIETRDDAATGEGADLAGRALDDGRAHRDLAVAGKDRGAALADREDGGAVPAGTGR